MKASQIDDSRYILLLSYTTICNPKSQYIFCVIVPWPYDSTLLQIYFFLAWDIWLCDSTLHLRWINFLLEISQPVLFLPFSRHDFGHCVLRIWLHQTPRHFKPFSFYLGISRQVHSLIPFCRQDYNFNMWQNQNTPYKHKIWLFTCFHWIMYIPSTSPQQPLPPSPTEQQPLLSCSDQIHSLKVLLLIYRDKNNSNGD